MKFVFPLLAAAAASLALPALAQETADAPASNEAVKEAKEKPKKVCRRVEGATGTRFGGNGRVCKTEEQWAKIDNGGRSAGSLFVEQAKREEGQ